MYVFVQLKKGTVLKCMDGSSGLWINLDVKNNKLNFKF